MEIRIDSHTVKSSNNVTYTFPKEFNGIEITYVLTKEKGAKRYVLTKCKSCGTEKKTSWADIKSGANSGYCSKCCNVGENNGRYSHGAYLGNNKRLYETWCNMKSRCGSQKVYKDVKVCDEWQVFETFKDWALSNGYSDELTIDRIDPNGNYEPDNCQWITRSENSSKDKFKLNSEDIEFIKIAKAKGYTYAKIGIMLGVDGSTIARYHKNSI